MVVVSITEEDASSSKWFMGEILGGRVIGVALITLQLLILCLLFLELEIYNTGA